MSGNHNPPSKEQLEAAMKRGVKKLQRILELEKELLGDRTLAWQLVEKENNTHE